MRLFDNEEFKEELKITTEWLQTNQSVREDLEQQFLDNLENDPDFSEQWNYCEGSQTKVCPYDTRVLTAGQAKEELKKSFYEWVWHYYILYHGQ